MKHRATEQTAQTQALIARIIAAPNEIAKAAKNDRNFALASDFSSREGVNVGSDLSGGYLASSTGYSVSSTGYSASSSVKVFKSFLLNNDKTVISGAVAHDRQG